MFHSCLASAIYLGAECINEWIRTGPFWNKEYRLAYCEMLSFLHFSSDEDERPVAMGTKLVFGGLGRLLHTVPAFSTPPLLKDAAVLLRGERLLAGEEKISCNFFELFFCSVCCFFFDV
ncbi:hypothetical protein AVEN_244050-1 [Araneus ventricosus]|uniref:Uncharacterized protein n=1 Tax=Araneus ventricosus TaxID=182803 RepID=A0A4Y2IJS5_ARAVE|nr:hypothetical protein AVEN_244050-1 [Araneus ventricosus]